MGVRDGMGLGFRPQPLFFPEGVIFHATAALFYLVLLFAG